MAKPTDLVQGTLDLLILKTISLEPKHGWAIAKRIQQVSREALQIQQGSLYPALHRLEQQGWIESEWRPTETGRMPSSIRSLALDGGNYRRSWQAGHAFRLQSTWWFRRFEPCARSTKPVCCCGRSSAARRLSASLMKNFVFILINSSR